MRLNLKVLYFVVSISLLTGCLSGPLPEDLPKTTTLPTQPPPDLDSLTFVPFDSVSYTPDSEFSHLIPKMEGLEFLPHVSPVDVMSNDLSVLNHPRRLQILASITGKQSVIYAKPKRDTNFLIYYTVYKLNDSETSLDVLEAYKGEWNKRFLNISGAEIWIWDGYLDEIAGLARPQGKDSILYMNPQTQTTFLTDRILPDQPAISKTETVLYSMHGETAYKEYFIMIDIKTELEDIQNKTDSIFTQFAKKIFQGIPTETENTSAPIQDIAPEPSTENETVEELAIKEDLRKLLESYLAGNITKSEYDLTFEEYNARLANLTKES
jgi:hypothetical protein